MILLLDVGNTRLKWGVSQNGRWLDRGVSPVDRLSGLGEQFDGLGLRGVVASCVAGEAVRSELSQVFSDRDIPVHWLRATAERCGVRNAYARPEQLGSDRFAILIACLHGGLTPCLVVSAGTALTVDALLEDGRHLGGVISPGLSLMRRALSLGTAGVQVEAGELEEFPTSTESAVVTGTRLALVGVVREMQARFAGRLGQKPRLVLSGGDGAALLADLGGDACLRPNLVLEGLRQVAGTLGWEIEGAGH